MYALMSSYVCMHVCITVYVYMYASMRVHFIRAWMTLGEYVYIMYVCNYAVCTYVCTYMYVCIYLASKTAPLRNLTMYVHDALSGIQSNNAYNIILLYYKSKDICLQVDQ